MRLLATSLLVFFAAIAASPAMSAEQPYDRAAFQAAQSAGQPVAVVFHADWCPTCRAQAPLLKQLMLDPQRKQMTLFVANFDTEMALRKELGVAKQSTLIVFNKGHEVARSTGDTQQENLAALLSKAGV